MSNDSHTEMPTPSSIHFSVKIPIDTIAGFLVWTQSHNKLSRSLFVAQVNNLLYYMLTFSEPKSLANLKTLLKSYTGEKGGVEIYKCHTPTVVDGALVSLVANAGSDYYTSSKALLLVNETEITKGEEEYVVSIPSCDVLDRVYIEVVLTEGSLARPWEILKHASLYLGDQRIFTETTGDFQLKYDLGLFPKRTPTHFFIPLLTGKYPYTKNDTQFTFRLQFNSIPGISFKANIFASQSYLDTNWRKEEILKNHMCGLTYFTTHTVTTHNDSGDVRLRIEDVPSGLIPAMFVQVESEHELEHLQVLFNDRQPCIDTTAMTAQSIIPNYLPTCIQSAPYSNRFCPLNFYPGDTPEDKDTTLKGSRLSRIDAIRMKLKVRGTGSDVRLKIGMMISNTLMVTPSETCVKWKPTETRLRVVS